MRCRSKDETSSNIRPKTIEFVFGCAFLLLGISGVLVALACADRETVEWLGGLLPVTLILLLCTLFLRMYRIQRKSTLIIQEKLDYLLRKDQQNHSQVQADEMLRQILAQHRSMSRRRQN